MNVGEGAPPAQTAARPLSYFRARPLAGKRLNRQYGAPCKLLGIACALLTYGCWAPAPTRCTMAVLQASWLSPAWWDMLTRAASAMDVFANCGLVPPGYLYSVFALFTFPAWGLGMALLLIGGAWLFIKATKNGRLEQPVPGCVEPIMEIDPTAPPSGIDVWYCPQTLAASVRERIMLQERDHACLSRVRSIASRWMDDNEVDAGSRDIYMAGALAAALVVSPEEAALRAMGSRAPSPIRA